MNVDCRHGQMVVLGELVKSVNTCHALFDHAPHVLGSPRELGQEAVSGVSSVVKDHCRLPARRLGDRGQISLATCGVNVWGYDLPLGIGQCTTRTLLLSVLSMQI